MLTDTQISTIVTALYQIPEFNGVVVGHYNGSTCRVVHSGYMVSVNYGARSVIIEETTLPPGQTAAVPPPSAPAANAGPPAVMNSSRAGTEMLGAGLSCGAAVISGIGVLGSAAAEVPTGGLSTFLLVASWAGFVTSSVQCLNGVVRTVEAYRNPGDNSLQRWDDNRIYSTASFIVDAIGVASAVASLPAATRNLIEVLRRQRALVLTIEELNAMNRAQRAAAIRQAVAAASRNPESARVLQQALAEAGIAEQTLARASLSVRNAGRARAIISEETTRRVYRAVLEVFGGISGPAMSGMPSSMIGSASGSVNTTGGLILHLVAGDS